MYNEIFHQKAYISLDNDYTYDEINDMVCDIVWCDLYSYFVGRKDDVIVIKTVVSLNQEFNALPYREHSERITQSIIDYIMTLSESKCICFGQPPIDLMVVLYENMIAKLSRELSSQWKYFEYDDLVGMGYKVMVDLYNKGYYINKSVLRTALTNEVLVECRKFKGQPVTVSIYDKMQADATVDGEKLTYGDILEDESYKEEEERNDEQQLESYIFNQVKDIIIDKIGERQWDRLRRDYEKGHTTGASQAAMRRIKAYFNELGLTRQDFINGYRRQ